MHSTDLSKPTWLAMTYADARPLYPCGATATAGACPYSPLWMRPSRIGTPERCKRPVAASGFAPEELGVLSQLVSDPTAVERDREGVTQYPLKRGGLWHRPIPALMWQEERRGAIRFRHEGCDSGTTSSMAFGKAPSRESECFETFNSATLPFLVVLRPAPYDREPASFKDLAGAHEACQSLRQCIGQRLRCLVGGYEAFQLRRCCSSAPPQTSATIVQFHSRNRTTRRCLTLLRTNSTFP